jgi:hypothetical protein
MRRCEGDGDKVTQETRIAQSSSSCVRGRLGGMLKWCYHRRAQAAELSSAMSDAVLIGRWGSAGHNLGAG